MKPYIIVYMNSKLGLELCRHMLFLHAFTGLDKTNLRIFHIGKSRFSKTTYRYHEISCGELYN